MGNEAQEKTERERTVSRSEDVPLSERFRLDSVFLLLHSHDHKLQNVLLLSGRDKRHDDAKPLYGLVEIDFLNANSCSQ